MAEEKKTFPMLPIAHWWALRRRFKQSIPGVVTDNYLAAELHMGVKSARANVLPFLKTLGIIDDEGKSLERARLWRDDGHYAEVCKAMLKQVYPQDLLEAVPNPNAERAEAERWFANQTGPGKAAVGRMTALYAVLADADASRQAEQDKKTRVRKLTKEAGEPKAEAGAATGGGPAASTAIRQGTSGAAEQAPMAPGININLQVHISADATPD